MAYNKSKPKYQIKFTDLEGSKNSATLPLILGQVPNFGYNLQKTLDILMNAMLRLRVTPCKANFKPGMTLFTIEDDWEKYSRLLLQHGFTPNPEHITNKAINIAAMAESFPTDSFTNEYGEHFLSKIADIGGSAFGEMAQMSGSETGTKALQNLGGGMEGVGGVIGSIGSGIKSAGEYAEGLKDKLKASDNKMISGMADMADRLIAGARIDFPMVWKNSSYNPTFSINIKLYNPNPGNIELTNKYIIGPIAALLILGLPRSQEDTKDDFSYNWPFFCKINCPGLFKVNTGAITNISIQKGGDQNLVGYNQKVGMVNVRMDFINLHNTLIVSKFGEGERPTLQGYLNNLRDNKEVINVREDLKKDIKTQPTAANTQSSTQAINQSETPPPRKDAELEKEQIALQRASGGFLPKG